MQLPLFPLHTVLAPGVAMPLHVFEDRYRVMINRSIERGEPFGVVLIREGRETGRLQGRIAEVGTTALIRQAGKLADGKMNIMVVGGRRFRITRLDETSEPYLVADVELLDEPLGDEDISHGLAERVSDRFLRYLELLQPALDDDDGPEIEVEIEIETSDEDDIPHEHAMVEAVDDPDDDPSEIEQHMSALTPATDAERHEILMAAARRLANPDDPTALAYVLSGLVHIDLATRQSLLEAPDSESRLRQLDAVLSREIQFLGRRLKPLAIDPRLTALRRN